MGKIYSLADLKGKVKVGWVVKAVPVKPNKCGELHDDGSNTQKITDVDAYSLSINGCFHNYRDDSFVEVVSGYEKTLDSLEPGDVLLTASGNERTVIDVLPHSVLLSFLGDPDIVDDWYTPAELRASGYRLKDQPEPTDLTELTLDEIAEKFEVPVDKLRIKDAQ